MCGIVGICHKQDWLAPDEAVVRQMLALLRHRGPDQFGIYHDQQVALGSARLSIIDLHSGQQPISNEDESLWIVFNGEIFNYLELRLELEKLGHQFATQTDTEVILHLYEEEGANCLSYLNGQFAIAIWDKRRRELFLARDRLGVRPLFYTIKEGSLIFGSEIKSLLAHPAVQAEVNPKALDQIFTYWASLAPQTIFKDIHELPAGHYLLLREGHLRIESYWELDFTEDSEARSLASYVDEFRELLIDATQIRLRADVPVGAYLSGGLDSSTIAAIIRNYTTTPLTSFSIVFDNKTFDESHYQKLMLESLGTEHHCVQIDDKAIAEIFPEVVWHSETPVLRTAPAPMFLLARLVKERGFKVVLTGEGADEFLAGYDIYKEDQLRRFWARQPHSALRPLLLRRLYPYIPEVQKTAQAYLAAFFSQGFQELERWDYSHHLRWSNTARAKRFFSTQLWESIRSTEDDTLDLPSKFMDWHPLARAQYLEVKTFLSSYLLSTQGDRMAMANSVEGRFPFLDYRLVEFCNRLPAQLKLRGLNEKYLLKQVAKEWLPEAIWKRVKQPYRAPVHQSFFAQSSSGEVLEALSPERIRAVGLFDEAMVQKLLAKLQRGLAISEGDDMAFIGILSSQLLHEAFIENFGMPAPITYQDNLKVCEGASNGL